MLVKLTPIEKMSLTFELFIDSILSLFCCGLLYLSVIILIFRHNFLPSCFGLAFRCQIYLLDEKKKLE